MAKKSQSLPREADRRRLPALVRQQLLLEAGYKCGNPVCRNIIVLETHHIQYVSEGGGDDPSNLLVLCGYCHTMHHAGHIPVTAVRVWKGLLLAMNQAFDRPSMELLLFLHQARGQEIWYTGDGLLRFAGLIAAGLVAFTTEKQFAYSQVSYATPGKSGIQSKTVEHSPQIHVSVTLTERGAAFVDAWRSGDEIKFRELVSQPPATDTAPMSTAAGDAHRAM